MWSLAQLVTDSASGRAAPQGLALPEPGQRSWPRSSSAQR
jgi:hypothetical protein